MIQFDQVEKKYPDGTQAVQQLDLIIKKGEFFVLIGPSGCGKTTTLKMINRLIPISDGTLRIDGKKISEFDIHELRWNIGYVLQQIALFPHMTIAENIAVVPEMRKWNRSKISRRVDELLEMVGLDPSVYRNRKPSELSGGQQQRIGVIRALAADPEVILMDEPFSALDPISREKLQDDLLELQRKIQKTIVFVTHDMKEAIKLGDRLCVMKDGKVVQIGTPEEIIEHPANDFVKSFIGSHDRIEGRKVKEVAVQFPIGLKEGRTISAGAPISEALQLLAETDVLIIEENGQLIGSVTRETIIQFLAGEVRA
ncbi:ABC transporter ATP-binding protein [Domibacillus iocasae]|uniref:Quaternary amine transport ATP-binding protein n=1 Tax=Domibacillus iocasae TaxID=1714016 RepID=A0A1E7DSM8_9BACI|nr:ABC transporter ATP-binding protein [Domibacillus iocasae]OES45688.1 glycine/betaine ABC transporter ATP-binding protein [Domibacillus iocasae]